MKLRIAALPALAIAASLTAACGGGNAATDDTAAAPASSAPMPAESAPADATTTAPAASGPFGAACSAVPADGEGSFTGMADDPVATAASNNPVLSTLVTAVKKAGLVDTLNSANDITVFAPTNDAFAKIPEKDLAKVLADKKMLTDILTYHVVQGRKIPADLENGDFTTLQGKNVATSGSGEDYKAGDAAVVCGNVPTRNATVYIIDTVMMPPQ